MGYLRGGGGTTRRWVAEGQAVAREVDRPRPDPVVGAKPQPRQREWLHRVADLHAKVVRGSAVDALHRALRVVGGVGDERLARPLSGEAPSAPEEQRLLLVEVRRLAEGVARRAEADRALIVDVVRHVDVHEVVAARAL